MEATRDQIIALRQSPEFRSAFAEYLKDPKLLDVPRDALSEDDWGDLHDALIDSLMNEAPYVIELTAEMSKGVFPVSVRGVPGAYFVEAQEFDSEGLFSTLEEAEDYALGEFGEFLVEDED